MTMAKEKAPKFPKTMYLWPDTSDKGSVYYLTATGQNDIDENVTLVGVYELTGMAKVERAVLLTPLNK